ncbi:MAG: hypothetical protein HY815_28560 [Candidatus Riflebacteria bacterium]|nr:hypothetical protein [Candidatus Riflebacteria bacterium]
MRVSSRLPSTALTAILALAAVALAVAQPSVPSPDPGSDPSPSGATPASVPASAATTPVQFGALRPRLAPNAAPRGAIRDRTGRVLVADGPCWDIGIRYEVVVARACPEDKTLQDEYLLRVARQRASGGLADPDAARRRMATRLAREVDATWAEIAELTGLSNEELSGRCQRAVARVRAMKAAVARRHGRESVIAEERSYRPIGRIYGQPAGGRAAGRFDLVPWVRLTRSVARHAEGRDTLVHVLGRIFPANERRAAADPLAGDPLRRLEVGDLCGISGAERLGDPELRPRIDAAGTARAGADVRLTIDAELQQAVYRILERAVKASPSPCGGAAVVLDVATGEIRALVSYPAHPYDLSLAASDELADDARWMPLRFRAVSGVYPPGSTIKPATLYAALAEGAATPATRVTCSGRFRKDIPDSFRCWVFNRSGDTHGVEIAETALRDSCNIFFFTAGDTMGASPLVRRLEPFGLGTTQGTGLIEESPGILPTPAWLAAHRPQLPRHQRADAWNYAFGQGEMSVTPLQMANIAATIARGRFEPVTLMTDAAGRRIGASRDMGPRLDERWLSTVRRGLWRVVNEKGGTAEVAKIDASVGTLCGKTGSAQAVPRVLSRKFVFELPDGTEGPMVAPTIERARARLSIPDARLVKQEVLERYPVAAEGTLPSHAWFIGYTRQPRSSRETPVSTGSYALSVLIEYGGGGGAVAGPVARDIARRLLEPAPVPGARAPKRRAGRSRQ